MSASIEVFAPGRINIIGEHVDYNQGWVLPAAIDLGIYMKLSKRADQKCLFRALDLDQNHEIHLDQGISLAPKNKSWANYLIGVTDLMRSKLPCGFEVAFYGDLPQGAGLSSSAALENALSYGLNELFKLHVSRQNLADISHRAEREYAGVNCGIMDQYASMLSEPQSALFLDCKEKIHTAIPLDLGDYEFILFDSRESHQLSESAYNDRRATCESVAKTLGLESLRTASLEQLREPQYQLSQDQIQKAQFVIEEIARVHQAVRAIKTKNLIELGQLMNASHHGLRDLYKVSTPALDFLQSEVNTHPEALGGRMMGGGFGGCSIHLIAKNKSAHIIEKVSKAFIKKFNHPTSPVSISIEGGARHHRPKLSS